MKSKPPSKRSRTENGNGQGQGSGSQTGHGGGGSKDKAKERMRKENPGSLLSTIEEIKSSMAASASEIFSSKKYIISSATMTATAAPSSITATTTPTTIFPARNSSSLMSLSLAQPSSLSSASLMMPLTSTSKCSQMPVLFPMTSMSKSAVEATSVSCSGSSSMSVLASLANSKPNSNSLLNSVLPFPHFTLLDINNSKDFPRLCHFGQDHGRCRGHGHGSGDRSFPTSPTGSHTQSGSQSGPIKVDVMPEGASIAPTPTWPPSWSNALNKSSPAHSPVSSPKTQDWTEAGGSGNIFTLEDIDGIQNELETLWSHVSVRIRSLEKEHVNLFGPISPSERQWQVQGSRDKSLSSSPPSLSLALASPGRGRVTHSHGTRTNTSQSPTKLLMLSSSVCATAASPVRLNQNKSPSPSTGSGFMSHRKSSASSTVSSSSAAGSGSVMTSTVSSGGGGSCGGASMASAVGRGGSGQGTGGTGSFALLPTSSLKLAKLPKKKVKGEAATPKSQWTGRKPATRVGQNRAHSIAQDGGSSSAYREAAPNQFWDFADTYCRDVTYTDLYALEQTMEEHESLPDSLFDIPPLGPHFKRNGPSAPVTRCRDRIETRSQDTFGPLTQRLVSVLVDRSIANHLHRQGQDQGRKSNGNDNGTGPSNSTAIATGGAGATANSWRTNESNGDLVRNHTSGPFLDRAGILETLGLTCDSSAVNPSSSQPLEAKVRQVLLDQGFLSHEEIMSDSVNGDNSLLVSANGNGNGNGVGDDPKDEILVDIKHTQEQLRHLHEYNVEKLRELHLLAKRELERMRVKRELEKADEELIEAFKIVSVSRAKKKPLPNREREMATRALENRRAALCKLYQTNCSQRQGQRQGQSQGQVLVQCQASTSKAKGTSTSYPSSMSMSSTSSTLLKDQDQDRDRDLHLDLDPKTDIHVAVHMCTNGQVGRENGTGDVCQGQGQDECEEQEPHEGMTSDDGSSSPASSSGSSSSKSKLSTDSVLTDLSTSDTERHGKRGTRPSETATAIT